MWSLSRKVRPDTSASVALLAMQDMFEVVRDICDELDDDEEEAEEEEEAEPHAFSFPSDVVHVEAAARQTRQRRNADVRAIATHGGELVKCVGCCTYLCMPVPVAVAGYACVCACMYVCMYVCVYACILHMCFWCSDSLSVVEFGCDGACCWPHSLASRFHGFSLCVCVGASLLAVSFR